jgi:multiple sugar transport system ATP-binding protein
MAKVSLKNIWKTFDKAEVVKDFSLEIADQEMVVFVGPSGCGKSTTLRMIAGLEEISKGQLYIGDRLVNDLAPKDRDVAMVFQNYALYPHMNVYENMAFSLKLRKLERAGIDTKVKTAAQILQIGHLLERKPKELSGGQRQRVAMGRAIVREPAVFLMDEPLSNLDYKLRVTMRSEIMKLQRRLRTTTIYVTHDQTEAMTMGDRIVVMKDGVIQQVDTPMNLYKKPCNRFVAGFMGSPSMNFIDVRVELQGETLLLTAPGIALAVPQGAANKLQPYRDKSIVFGVRPEEIYDELALAGRYGYEKVAGKIEMVELLGAESILHLQVGNQEVRVRVAGGNEFRISDTVTFAVNMNQMHAFDPESELAIL